MNKVLLFVALLVVCASCVKWRGYDEDGNPVARTFKLLRSPLTGQDHVIEWRATQKDLSKHDKLKNREIDAIQFTFSTNFFPHYVVRHFQKDADGTEKRAARHGLRKIVEYEEAGADGFDPDVDTNLQNYTLWNKNWSKIKKEESTVGDSNVVTACTHTDDEVVELCIMFTDILATLTVNGSKFTIDNNAIHHTLSIKNFPFTSNTSRLALKVHYHMKDRIRDFDDSEAVDSNTEAAVDLSSEDDDSIKIRPVASWKKEVSACDATAPVKRDVLREKESTRDVDVNFPSGETDGISFTLKERITYFSFLTTCAQPDIYWDPDLGIVDDSDDSLASLTMPSVLALVILAVWSMF